MSIINEALRKTQQIRKGDKDKREKVVPKSEPAVEAKPAITKPVETTTAERKREVVEPRRPQVVKKSDFLFTWKMASLLTVAALLAVMVVNNQQRLTSAKNYSQNNAAATTAVAQAKTKTKIAFEGVFLSDNAKIALINKQSLHVGDVIDGMRVVAINQDTVDLQNANGTIELKAGATYLI